MLDLSVYAPEFEYLPRPQLRQLQEQRLLAMLPHAYQHAPLIREVWDAAGIHPSDITSLAEFQQHAPFINQDALRDFRSRHQDPFGGLLGLPRSELLLAGTTSGTTGNPTPLGYGAINATEIASYRDHLNIGSKPGEHAVFFMFPHRSGYIPNLCRRLGVTLIPFAHSPLEIPRFVDISLKYRPTTLFLLSNPILMALDAYAQKTGIDMRDVFASYKGVVYGGEPMNYRLRKLVKDWGIHIYNYTALADICAGMDCADHSGFHAPEDLALVEILDANGNTPVADGEIGELVGTTLVGQASPLIRFRSDDMVRANHERCSCGRTTLRYELVGRKSDEMQIAGKSIFPMDIWQLIEEEHDTRMGLFQIVKNHPDQNCLYLVVGYQEEKMQRSIADLQHTLQQTLGTHLDVSVSIELVPAEALLKLGPPHKIPRTRKYQPR